MRSSRKAGKSVEQDGKIGAVIPSIALTEIRWVLDRVAVMNEVDCLVSTDTHLLKAKETRILDPVHFMRLKH